MEKREVPLYSGAKYVISTKNNKLEEELQLHERAMFMLDQMVDDFYRSGKGVTEFCAYKLLKYARLSDDPKCLRENLKRINNELKFLEKKGFIGDILRSYGFERINDKIKIVAPDCILMELNHIRRD